MHNDGFVVEGWLIDLEEALCAAFVVDECTVTFRKTAGGEDQRSLIHNVSALMIQHNHICCGIQRTVNSDFIRMAVKVVFHHHHGIRAAVCQQSQCFIQRLCFCHGGTKAVGFRADKGQPGINAFIFQCPGHVCRRLNQCITARVAAADNQRFFRTVQRLCNHFCLYFHICR